MENIKIVAEINTLCESNEYKSAGILARKHKNAFIHMIQNGGNAELLYAHEVCSYFNLLQTHCDNLKYLTTKRGAAADKGIKIVYLGREEDMNWAVQDMSKTEREFFNTLDEAIRFAQSKS